MEAIGHKRVLQIFKIAVGQEIGRTLSAPKRERLNDRQNETASKPAHIHTTQCYFTFAKTELGFLLILSRTKTTVDPNYFHRNGIQHIEKHYRRFDGLAGDCGSDSAHVASIMERVRSLPGTWEPGDTIRVRSKTVKPLSEGHIYDVLNMSLVVPWRRGSESRIANAK